MSNPPMTFDAPFDEEMERYVLGSTLINPAVWVVLSSILQTNDFYLTRHQYIWSAFQRVAESGGEIERATVRRALQDMGHWKEVGEDLYLSELVSVTPSAMYAEQYARLVQRDGFRRRLLTASMDLSVIARDRQLSVEEIAARAERRIFDVSASANDEKVAVSLRQSAIAVLDSIDAAQNKTTAMGLPTGFKRLDELLAGLHKSDLLILAGRPGMGKTSMALSILLNVSLHFKARVLHFSLEMGHEQVTQRLVSMQTGVQMKALRTGQMSDKHISLTVEALSRVAEWPSHIDDSPSLTPLQMRAKAQRVKLQHGLDLIIVDYLQLMNSPAQKGNRVQEVSYISRQLKEMARDLNVPVLALAQLSRKVEDRKDKRPVMSDLRESGDIENNADVIAFIYRDVVYNEATENPHQADVIIAKHRNGPTDTVSLYFDAASTRFRDGTRQNIDLNGM